MNDTKRYTSMMKWAAPTLMVLAQATSGCAASEADKEPVQVSAETKSHDVKTKDWCPSGDPNCWVVTVTDDSPPDPWTVSGYDPYGGGGDNGGEENHGGGSGGDGADEHTDPNAETQTYHSRTEDYLRNSSPLQIAQRSKDEAKANCEAAIDMSSDFCAEGTYSLSNRVVKTSWFTDCGPVVHGWLGDYMTCTTTITVRIQ